MMPNGAASGNAMTRKRIFSVIEKSDGNDLWSSVYDYAMIVLIVASLVPLAFKSDALGFRIVDAVCVAVFGIDYLLRRITADYKFGKRSVGSFLRYPFSAMALIDLLSILPSLTVLNSGLKLLRVLRLIRACRVFRVFKALRYSKSITIIADTLKSSRDSLLAVGSLAVGYILVSALLIFNVEPDSFRTFFDAIYWATISLTTVGYGDIYPVSTLGRIVTMVSSVFGIAIVALPAGIITGGYMTELEKSKALRQAEKRVERDPDRTDL